MSAQDQTLLGGRYRLVERLGRGGVGEVWRARDEARGVDVAVKLLLSLHLHNAQLAQRFAREARLLARVESAHVCKVLDASFEGQTPYLVMELVAGTTLDRFLRGARALSWMQAAPIVEEVLEGLAAVHAAAIVHRDLKPSNVLVDHDGRAVLIDFGMSKLLADGEIPITSTQATLGTPLYMAPEQLDGSAAVDARCDVYAAGTLAFRVLAGTLPFAADQPMQLLALKRAYAAPTLSERTGLEWPAPLDALLARMLALRPQDRPRDAAEALAAFRVVRAQLGGFVAPEIASSGVPSMDAETPVMSRRRR